MDFIYRDFIGVGDIRIHITDKNNIDYTVLKSGDLIYDCDIIYLSDDEKLNLYESILTALNNLTMKYFYINNKYKDFIISETGGYPWNNNRNANSYGGDWLDFTLENFYNHIENYMYIDEDQLVELYKNNLLNDFTND